MGKALNNLVNRSDEANAEKNIIRLTVVDILHPRGSREKAIIKDRNKNPHTKIVTKVRDVTYLYDNDKVSQGYEIVEEVSIPLSEAHRYANFKPIVADEITRDYRSKIETAK